jgi:predicted butyrate kinase (DUF1464 family)
MSAAPRVLGFDPGTVTTDLCVLVGGRLEHAASVPTSDLASDPRALLDAVRALGAFDLIAAPSGYGLPLLRGEQVDERALRTAFLAPPGEASGILGLRRAAAALAEAGQPLVFLPGVVQLTTVPAHRKVNRVDLGTADKVCAAALAVAEQALRREIAHAATSLILVEMGGAFTAVLAVEGGAIVDGVGGSSGPLGFRAVGSLDGEAAVLAGEIPKGALFTGGAAWVAGEPDIQPADWEARSARASEADDASSAVAPDARAQPRRAAPAREARLRLSREAYLEGIVKAVAALSTSAPSAREVALSGRLAWLPRLATDLTRRLARTAPGLEVRPPAARRTVAEPLTGAGVTPGTAPEAALGAALIADGLCGGSQAPLVAALRLAESSGSVLDHLYWPPARAGADRFVASFA